MLIFKSIMKIFRAPVDFCLRSIGDSSSSSRRTREPLPMLDETNYVEVETSPLQAAREYRTIPGRLAPTLTQDFTDYMHSKSMYTFCIVNLAVYILVAVVAYSFIFEDWPVIDSIYFACVTFTTVGYGDVTPTNDLSRAFTCLFALYGIVILGLLIGLIGEIIVERNNAFMAVAQASAQERVLKLFGDADTVDNDTRTAQALKEKTLLEAMRDVVALETPIILVIVIISLAIGRYEGWSAVASVYYGTITASTIGFGDFSPATPEMRIVIIFFIPIAVSVFCEVLGRIAGAYMERQTVTAEKEFLNRQVTLTDLERMDVNKDGKVTWGEFMAFMLVAMQKIEQEDVDQLRAIFEKLDKDKSQHLDKKDLQTLARGKTRHWFGSPP